MEQIYRQVVNALEYENDTAYRPDETGFFDACYYAETEQEMYPLVGIKRLDSYDEEQIMRQHLRYWNRNDVPISILILPGEFRIYNNFSINKKALLYKSSDKKKDEWWMKALNSSNVTSKILWEKLTKLSSPRERVDRQLLNNLKYAVEQACRKYGMNLDHAYNFMSQCIFVKYLEDRGMLTEQAFQRWQTDTFLGLLEKKVPEEVYAFFQFLKKRFNGDLFDVCREELPAKDQMEVFCGFFRGDDFMRDGNRQMRLFPYDFSVIPIGLVSHIYETFFSMDDEWKREKKAAAAGAFYTPHYMADFMVRQCMEACESNEKIPSVLDPACGSGVFLVSAFKYQIAMKKKVQGSIEAKELRELLMSAVYGVDTNAGALRISCFSLYIALLDELNPKDILENQFQFPNLIGYNLIHESFFSGATDWQMETNKVDIIVGNPPWKSMPNGDHITYCEQNKIPISDSQIAQAFMVRVRDFTKSDTLVSLLVTNSIFTNKNSKPFRDFFLDNFYIKKIINFELLKQQLFSCASYPCSIVTYRCTKQQDYKLLYHTVHPNMLFRLLHQFVFDKNEEVLISKSRLRSQDYLWTTLVYGDEFDAELLGNLFKQPLNLKQLIDGKLEFKQGYITGQKGERCEEFTKYKGGSLNGCFFPYGVDYKRLSYVSNHLLVERARDIGIYLCPDKLLMKRTFNKQCWGAAYIQEAVVFSNDFSAFLDNTGNYNMMLRYLEGLLNSKIFWYYCYYVTKVMVAKKPEVVKEDILCFPVPPYQEKDNAVRCLVELVCQMEELVHTRLEEQVGNPFYDNSAQTEKVQSEINEQVCRMYGLNEFERAILEDGLARFESNKEGGVCASEQDYQGYSAYLCEFFNYYVKSDNYIWRSRYDIGELYTTMSFSIMPESGEQQERQGVPADIMGMAGLKKINDKMLVQNRILSFSEEGFQIVQTKEKRNWSIGRARKETARITRYIFDEGGTFNDEEESFLV